MFSTEFDDMSDLKHFRAVCGYLRLRFERNTPALSRKQVSIELKKLFHILTRRFRQFDIQNIELQHKVAKLEDQKMEVEARNRTLEDLIAQNEHRLEIIKGILRMHNIPEGPSSQRAASPAPTEPAVEQHFDDFDSM